MYSLGREQQEWFVSAPWHQDLNWDDLSRTPGHLRIFLSSRSAWHPHVASLHTAPSGTHTPSVAAPGTQSECSKRQEVEAARLWGPGLESGSASLSNILWVQKPQNPPRSGVRGLTPHLSIEGLSKNLWPFLFYDNMVSEVCTSHQGSVETRWPSGDSETFREKDKVSSRALDVKISYKVKSQSISPVQRSTMVTVNIKLLKGFAAASLLIRCNQTQTWLLPY